MDQRLGDPLIQPIHNYQFFFTGRDQMSRPFFIVNFFKISFKTNFVNILKTSAALHKYDKCMQNKHQAILVLTWIPAYASMTLSCERH